MLQTEEHVLEPLTLPAEAQTEPLQRQTYTPRTPVPPAGLDVGTQMEDGELFDFQLDVSLGGLGVGQVGWERDASVHC